MYSSMVICIAAVLCLVPATSGSYLWWSVGVNPISENPPDQYQSLDCDSLNGTFTEKDIQYCKDNKPIVQLTAIGTRVGIIQCQILFDKYQWNCTTFQGQYLFGKFVNEGTKETAFINALLALASAKEIATECREEMIEDCTCSIQGVNGFYNGISKTYSCDDDPAFAKIAMNEFLNDTEELTTDTSAKRRAEIHNHNTGLEILQERNETCRCVGLSGSCTVLSCYFKSPDIDEIQDEVRSLYLSAVKVELNSDKTDIVPINSRAIFDDERLAYVSDSPSFCESDTTKGIIGSEHRECVTDSLSPNRCSVLCCNRGYYTTSEIITERVCKFIYCCRVECTEKQVTVERHYCNGKSGS